MEAVLTTYPLSSDFAAKLQHVVGTDATKLSVAELRQQSLPGLFRQLRKMRFQTVYVPLEDANSRVLAPVLLLIAGVTRARRIVLVNESLEQEAVSRLSILGGMIRLAWASVLGLFRVRKVKREAASLVKAPRVEIRKPAGKHGMFLNANLWFGVKAGGSVGHISGVVNAFDQLDYDMVFATAGGRMLVKPEVPCQELVPPRDFGVPWELNFYRFQASVVKQVEAFAATQPVDFLYQRMSIANYSGVSLSRDLNIPLILEYNGSEAWVARNWGRPLRYQELAEEVEAVCLRHAHLVVTISDVLRDELIERGVPAERVVTYPNCIDPEFINPDRYSEEERVALRARYGIASDAIVVAFLGTFGQWHGAEVLAKAAALLCDNDAAWMKEHKVHFLFVGDGVKMREVRDALGAHADGAHVTLAGLVPQRDAPAYLAASDILASPHVPNADGSRFFGSPTKLFEYLAMRRVILASDLDQIGEVLGGSVHVRDLPALPENDTSVALMATPGSAEEITAGVKFLVDNPAWREATAARAQALALSRYTWEHHVQAIVDQARELKILA